MIPDADVDALGLRQLPLEIERVEDRPGDLRRLRVRPVGAVVPGVGRRVDVRVPVDGAVRLELVLELDPRRLLDDLVDDAARLVEHDLIERVLDRPAESLALRHRQVGYIGRLRRRRVVIEDDVGGLRPGLDVGQESDAERRRRVVADDPLARRRVFLLDGQDLRVVPGDDVVHLAGDLLVNDVLSVPLRPDHPHLVRRSQVARQDPDRGVDGIARPGEAVLLRHDERHVALPGRVPIALSGRGASPTPRGPGYRPTLGSTSWTFILVSAPGRQTCRALTSKASFPPAALTRVPVDLAAALIDEEVP